MPAEWQSASENGALHVVAGPSAAACLRNALGLTSEQILVHHDPLSHGPLPPLDSLNDWREVRESYLRLLDVEGRRFSFEANQHDVVANYERLRAASTVTLWLGTGLGEQLLLVWIVALLHKLDAVGDRCLSVQFDRHKGYEVIGVGVLPPSAFAQHPPATGIAAAAIDEALSAWAAITATQPKELLAFIGDTRRAALPYLRRSLSSMLYHYPDVHTGLNAWEHQLLLYVREAGPKAALAIGYTMAHDMEFPEWMDDSYLFARLHRLADEGLRRPLLKLDGDATHLRSTEVRLTAHGEALLAGAGNAVEWNGIDDWVGGVHLDSQNGTVWFRKERTLIGPR